MFDFKPSLIFEITDQCDLRCSFCYERPRRKLMMTHFVRMEMYISPVVAKMLSRWRTVL